MTVILADNALTTIERARRFLGDEDASDESIAFAINSASAAIATYTQRSFQKARRIQMLEGDAVYGKVVCEEWPIREVHSINGREVSRSMFIDSEKGIIHFRSAVKGILEYTAGYTLPKDATEEEPRDLPYDLERACLITAHNLYIEEGLGYVGGFDSLDLGDFKVKSGSPNKSGGLDAAVIPDEALAILRDYKKWHL